VQPERWVRIEAILDKLLDAEPADCAQLLDEACGSDAELRHAVEDLLRRRTKVDEFLSGSVGQSVLEMGDTVVHEACARIGSYQLVREIAHGGMARVFLAERADGQFMQQVAIKLLRDGFTTPDLENRFRMERQILAMLNHPHIARLLDGGVTVQGLPFLVMEYVEGEPIDAFCDRNRLTVRERLQLFLKVADAVSYAHRNLVVHRDLKPSNIIVANDGQVKLLDFGIARLLSGAVDAAPQTRTVHHWLTPDYAAPEQLRGEPVTTATDVYQLGTILYVLLTGQLPFTNDAEGRPALERTRDSAMPQRLSTAVRQLRRRTGAGSAEFVRIGQARSVQPDSLAPMLRGDLDEIVLKALRREPGERYLSVDAFRADIDRYLSGRPVLAHRGSVAYRARKFISRNPWAVTGAATLILALAGYAILSAVHAERMEQALARAETERAKAEAGKQSLISLFSSRDPNVRLSDTLTVRQLLERGERHIGELKGQSLAQAQLHSVFGDVYTDMRDLPRAQTHFEKALALRAAALGETHADVAQSLLQLGQLLQSRGHYDLALIHYERALGIYRRNRDQSGIAQALFSMGNAPGFPLDSNIVLTRQALAVRARAHGPDHPLVAADLLYLGGLMRMKGQLEQAEQHYREALGIWRRALGAEHPSTLRAYTQLGLTLADRGNLDTAEQLFRQILTLREKSQGPDHADVAATLSNLASVLFRTGNYAEAETHRRRALAIRGRIYGEQHPSYAEYLAHLSEVLIAKGDLEEGENLRRRELVILENTYGRQHPVVAGSLYHLGLIRLGRGEDQDAERMLLRALAIRVSALGPESPNAALVLVPLARVARFRNDLPKAESLYVRALQILRKGQRSDSNVNVQRLHRELAEFYEQSGRPDKAAQHRAVLMSPR
jgi:serine/threonine-protein kinase